MDYDGYGYVILAFLVSIFVSLFTTAWLLRGFFTDEKGIGSTLFGVFAYLVLLLPIAYLQLLVAVYGLLIIFEWIPEFIGDVMA